MGYEYILFRYENYYKKLDDFQTQLSFKQHKKRHDYKDRTLNMSFSRNNTGQESAALALPQELFY